MIRNVANARDGAALERPTIEVTAVRPRPLPIGVWLLSAAAEVAALVLLAAHPGVGAASVAAAALLHVLSAAPLATARGLAPSERALAATMVLTLPVFGGPLAALALGTAGRAELAQAAPEEASAPPPLDPEEVRRMAEALPCCEALLAGEVEERRAIIATLTRRADGDALALLRWALGAPDADLAVEAALALEDVNATFEARLDGWRREMRERPSFEAALGAAETVLHAIEAGIADPSLVPSLAHEARGFFDEAGRLEPARYDDVALGRARLELAVLRPDSALACIDGALTTASPGARAELLALRQEAVLASHALPWEGPSALATYRPPMPPPLTSRRRVYGTRPATLGRSSTPRRFALFPIGEVTRDGD
jgi:hypothetical protein